MFNKKVKGLLLIAAVVVIAVSCAYFYMNTDTGTTVKIGYLPSDHDSALFVANAQKSYADKGINVQTVQFNNGGDLMSAMAGGDVDIGYVGITPVLASIEKGVPVKVVAGAQTEGSAIVVSSDSSIKSVSDLAGKTIATPGEASIQYMLLEYALNNESMDIKNLDVSAMKVSSMSDALKTGQIDAMVTYEPYASLAVQSGYGKILENSSQIIPEHPCCVVVASDSFIDNHPDTLKTIVNIHNQATEFISSNPDEAAKLLPSDIVANETVETSVLNQMHFVKGLNETYKQSIIDFMNIEVDLGVLKQPISQEKIFYEA